MISVTEILKTTITDVPPTQLATPLPNLLLFAWAIGVLVAIITLPVGIIRLRKGMSVTRIISLSRVTVFGTALACLCSTIDLFSTLIPMRAITNPTPSCQK